MTRRLLYSLSLFTFFGCSNQDAVSGLSDADSSAVSQALLGEHGISTDPASLSDTDDPNEIGLSSSGVHKDVAETEEEPTDEHPQKPTSPSDASEQNSTEVQDDASDPRPIDTEHGIQLATEGYDTESETYEDDGATVNDTSSSESDAIAADDAATSSNSSDNQEALPASTTDFLKSLDECDPARFHPIAVTSEDVSSGRAEQELEKYRTECELARMGLPPVEEAQDPSTESSPPKKSWGNGLTPITPGYQRAFNYLGESASNTNADDWFTELQGVANGESYWYFSQNNQTLLGTETRIFRVSYDQNLSSTFSVNKYWAGTIDGCGHVGDIAYYNGMIIAGYDDCGDDYGRIAIFDSSQLTPLCYIKVHKNVLGKPNLPVIAVRNGSIFTTKGSTLVQFITEFAVDWSQVPQTAPDHPVEIPFDSFVTEISSHPISINYSGDWDAWEDNNLHNVQGMDFSSDGSVAYISVGYCWRSLLVCEFCSPRALLSFSYSDTQTWQLTRASSNSYPFKYEIYHYGCDEEPEGLSYKDSRVISNYNDDMPLGELTVILLENDYFPDGNYDDAYIKHYSSVVNVLPPGTDLQSYIDDRWGDDNGMWDGSILNFMPSSMPWFTGGVQTNKTIKFVSPDNTTTVFP